MTENMLNFQPMTKRFMVWDKEFETFYGEALELWEIVSNFRDFSDQLKNGNRYILCQSTNLFDKDGKEIFEGSIVRYNPNNIHPIEDDSILLIYWHKDGAGFAVDYHGMFCRLDEIGKYCEVIGHILSNPELLEEKNK